MAGEDARPAARPRDYDSDPGRFRTARRVLREHALAPDIHARVAARLVAGNALPVLDVGCGEGELARHLPQGSWTGVDNSEAMLAAAPDPHVLAEAGALPFPDGSFGSLTLLYVLYHLSEPELALTEARRVLRSGGLVVAAAPSRHDSPELAFALPGDPLSFDAESAPELVGAQFGKLEVERWDAPGLSLTSRAAVRDYLIGKQADPERAERAAGRVELPLTVTKRGAWVLGRRL